MPGFFLSGLLMGLVGCASQGPAPSASVAPPLPAVAQSGPVTPDASAPPPVVPVVPAQSMGPHTAVSEERRQRLRNWIALQDRLYRVAAPLLIHNTALCPRSARAVLGLTAKTMHSYTAAYVQEARSDFGLDEQLRVMNVLPESGAQHSGILRGDILMSVDGMPLKTGPNAERNAGALINSAMQGKSAITLGLQRDGKLFAIKTPLTTICAFSIEVGDTDHINSYSNGYRVMITRGMVASAQNDEELAYMLAKEIAHAILAKPPRPRMTAAINALQFPHAEDAARNLPPLPAYSPVLDANTDKLSLYLLARAGYRYEQAPAFWKRFAANAARNNGRFAALHPATAYRLSVMERVVELIRETKQAGRSLKPA